MLSKVLDSRKKSQQKMNRFGYTFVKSIFHFGCTIFNFPDKRFDVYTFSEEVNEEKRKNFNKCQNIKINRFHLFAPFQTAVCAGKFLIISPEKKTIFVQVFAIYLFVKWFFLSFLNLNYVRVCGGWWIILLHHITFCLFIWFHSCFSKYVHLSFDEHECRENEI